MKEFVLKYHKALTAIAVILVPGSDSIVNLVQNSGIDFSAVALALGSTNPKIWAISAIVALYPYLKHHFDKNSKEKENEAVKEMIADFKKQLDGMKK